MKLYGKEFFSDAEMVKSENIDESQYAELEQPKEEIENRILPKKVEASAMPRDAIDFEDRVASFKSEEDVLTDDHEETIRDMEELGFLEQPSDGPLSTEFEAVMDKKPLKYEYPDWSGTIADSPEQPEEIRSQYQCTSCSRTFRMKGPYEKHKMTFPCYRPFICEMCGISCSCEDSLRDHVMRNHIGNEQNSVIKSRFPCHVCGLSFKYKSDLETHTRMLTCRKSFSCDCCGTKFRLKKDLIEHMKTHPGMSTHQCQICNQSCISLRGLQKHLKSHLNLGLSTGDVCDKTTTHESTANQYSKKHTHERRFRCPLCDIGFSLKQSVICHLLKCMYRTKLETKPVSCNICQESYSSLSRCRSHMQSHVREKSYPCGTCGKILQNKYSWKYHMINHTKRCTAKVRSEESYSCEICRKLFKSKAHALKHRERQHPPGDEPFSCDVCGKSFTLKCDLRKHLMKHMCNFCGKICKRTCDLVRHKKLHTGNKLFSCRIWDESFVSKNHLSRHCLTHAVEKSYLQESHMTKHATKKPYPCEICDKTFRIKSTLWLHKQKAHPGYGRMSCDVCGRTFFLKYDLRLHLNTHSFGSVWCEICGKTYQRESYLQKHMRSHAVEIRSFSCDICDKTFTCRTSLLRHFETHTDEKPHLCHTCNRGFRHHTDRQMHLKIHASQINKFPCEVCDKKFCTKERMEKHRMRHEGHASFSCDICYQTFAKEIAVKRHKRKLHPT